MTTTDTLKPPAATKQAPALNLNHLVSQAIADQQQKERDRIAKAKSDYFELLTRRTNARPGDGKAMLKVLDILRLTDRDVADDSRAMDELERIMARLAAAQKAYQPIQRQLAELRRQERAADVPHPSQTQRDQRHTLSWQIRELEEGSEHLRREVDFAERQRKEFYDTPRPRRIFGNNW